MGAGTGKAAHRTAGRPGGTQAGWGRRDGETRAYCPFLPMGFTPASLRRRKGWTAASRVTTGKRCGVPVRGRLFGVIRHSLGAPDGQAVAAMGIWASASGGAGNLPIRAGERRFSRAEGCRWGHLHALHGGRGGLCGVPVRGRLFGVIRHSLGAPDGQAVAAMGIWASASGGAGNLPICVGGRRFSRAEGCRWGHLHALHGGRGGALQCSR